MVTRHHKLKETKNISSLEPHDEVQSHPGSQDSQTLELLLCSRLEPGMKHGKENLCILLSVSKIHGHLLRQLQETSAEYENDYIRPDSRAYDSVRHIA